MLKQNWKICMTTFDMMVMARKNKFILWHLNNVLFVNFLENWNFLENQNIPNELILKKNYLQDCYKTNYSKCTK